MVYHLYELVNSKLAGMRRTKNTVRGKSEDPDITTVKPSICMSHAMVLLYLKVGVTSMYIGRMDCRTRGGVS